MNLNKYIRFSFIIVIFCSTLSKADEKIELMDVINNAPRCYVLTEFLNLYSKDKSVIMENFYINFYNALTLLNYSNNGEDNKPLASALMFNEETVVRRKILLTGLINTKNYSPNIYNKLYDNLNCKKYSEITDIKKYSHKGH